MGFYDNKNLIKKAIIFGFFLLFFILLGNTSSYCSFNFTGIDNVEYTLPDLPDTINNDTHFFIVRSVWQDIHGYPNFKLLANNNLNGFQFMINNTYHKFLFLYNGANGYSSSSNLFYTKNYDSDNWVLQTLEGNNNDTNYNLYIKGFPQNETLIYSTDNVYTYTQRDKPSSTDNLQVYALNNKQNIIQVQPTIANQTSTIENWSFNNLVINLNDVGATWLEDGIVYEPNWWELEIDYQGVVYTIDLTDYFVIKNNTSSGSVIVVPKNEISQHFNIRNGEQITFTLMHYKFINNRQFRVYDLPTYTFNITTAEEEQINQDSTTQAINNINNNINQTNQSINNLNNTQQQTNNKLDGIQNVLTDDNFDSSVADNLLTDSNIQVDDPSGIDNLFMLVYNAFCVNPVQDLTFTIPYVNKPFTISAANFTNKFPQDIKALVGGIVWGFCALYVLKDIRGIINKIREGNIENSSGDIKKEVL